MLELGTDPRFVVQLHATSRALLSTLDHDLRPCRIRLRSSHHQIDGTTATHSLCKVEQPCMHNQTMRILLRHRQRCIVCLQSWQHLLILIILYCLYVGDILRWAGNFIKTKLATRDLVSLRLISLKMAGHIFLSASEQ
jgi:hypothetical protein